MWPENFNADHWLADNLLNLGVSEVAIPYATLAFDLAILICVAVLVDWIARKVILRTVEAVVKRSKTEIDDIFIKHRVFRSVAHVLPAIVFLIGSPFVFKDFQEAGIWFDKVAYLLMVGAVLWVVFSFLNAAQELLEKSTDLKDKPVQSYVQVAKLLAVIMAFVLATSTLLGKSPLVVLSAFGAVAAVLIFVFKDTILGLVASVQISVNDLVRVGDWVTMEKFRADGDVIDISLTTIKIQNWDKTISSIPTYMFTIDSFKNWRGMQESGGRRIKRSILIKISSVKFCSPEMIERYRKFQILGSYLDNRLQEVNEYNQDLNVDKTYPINGRHLTNLGIFRKYIELLISDRQGIHKTMTKMVRQLDPASEGVPLEIYCFTDTTEWLAYEQLQADLFDHLLASVPLFDLEVFENPTGSDFSKLTN